MVELWKDCASTPMASAVTHTIKERVDAFEMFCENCLPLDWWDQALPKIKLLSRC